MKWSESTMSQINQLTPDIKGKSFDPDWFLLRERLEQVDDIIGYLRSCTAWIRRAGGDCKTLDDFLARIKQ